jgi:ParB family transcriptional regulator, chromosome partitioning protein
VSVLIPIDKLRPDPANPRRAGVGDVTELAESMAAVGVLQPLRVTPDPEVPDGFLVVFGHRRLAGAKVAKLSEVPAEVRDIDPVDRMAIQLVEISSAPR